MACVGLEFQQQSRKVPSGLFSIMALTISVSDGKTNCKGSPSDKPDTEARHGHRPLQMCSVPGFPEKELGSPC